MYGKTGNLGRTGRGHFCENAVQLRFRSSREPKLGWGLLRSYCSRHATFTTKISSTARSATPTTPSAAGAEPKPRAEREEGLRAAVGPSPEVRRAPARRGAERPAAERAPAEPRRVVLAATAVKGTRVREVAAGEEGARR